MNIKAMTDAEKAFDSEFRDLCTKHGFEGAWVVVAGSHEAPKSQVVFRSGGVGTAVGFLHAAIQCFMDTNATPR